MEVVQRGRDPRDFRPLPDISATVVEIRVRAGGAYRVFYVTRFDLLHCFWEEDQGHPAEWILRSESDDKVRCERGEKMEV